MNFETEIKERRQAAGLTQAELADRVGVTRQTILYVEKGEYNPSLTLAWRLARERDADFLITDDLRALPELQAVTETRIAISPIVLRALVERDVLAVAEARADVERLAEKRDWLGAPIYRRARKLFEG